MATTNKVSPEQVLDALAAHPGATSAALAEVLGIGQSTAAKHLAALEAAGSAHREPGGRDGGRRLADRWNTAASAPDDNTAAADDPEPDQVDAAAAGSAERLGRGALGVLVREYLAARPGEELGPTQIGKALDRSQGAVSNALARLEAAGVAELVSPSPRRYRIVSR
ncbi:MAG: MarR family transcriptional regulator [Acidimicrobiales bacterium]|nr:MarR family transcriptional regulator [Acidimicrobiales bacterium]